MSLKKTNVMEKNMPSSLKSIFCSSFVFEFYASNIESKWAVDIMWDSTSYFLLLLPENPKAIDSWLRGERVGGWGGGGE